MRKFARRIVLYRVPICGISRFGRWLLLFCSTLHWFLAFHSTNLQAVRKLKQAGFDTFPAYREVPLAPFKVPLALCKVPLAPCKDKVLRIPEFRKFLLMVESGIHLKESGFHSLESRIRHDTTDNSYRTFLSILGFRGYFAVICNSTSSFGKYMFERRFEI